MAEPILVTHEHVRRFEAVLYRAVATRLRPIALIPDNGQGYATFERGPVRASLSTNPYADYLVGAYGVSDADEPTVRATLEFFRSHGVKPVMRIVPGGFDADRARLLTSLGLAHTDFHAVLCGPLPWEPSPVPTGIDVRHATDIAEHDLAHEAQMQGFGAPPNPDSPIVRLRRAWRELPDHRTYVAYVNGEPAGAAMLYVEGDVGYLESGATIPRVRGRGVHAALIARRARDAAALGCTTLLGAADFGSTSYRNQRRAGLELAYVAAIWTGREDVKA